jgi:hypothetical protein
MMQSTKAALVDTSMHDTTVTPQQLQLASVLHELHSQQLASGQPEDDVGCAHTCMQTAFMLHQMTPHKMLCCQHDAVL